MNAPLFPILRGAYLGGLSLLFIATGMLLFRFRPTFKRVVAIAYGMGFALIFNELSVFLAFDTFWIDMTHRDTTMTFDPIQLYTRSEGHYAIGIGLGILLQAAFLRRFYRRVVVIGVTRIRKLLG